MYIDLEQTVAAAVEAIKDGRRPARRPSDEIIVRSDEVLIDFFVKAWPTRIGQTN